MKLQSQGHGWVDIIKIDEFFFFFWVFFFFFFLVFFFFWFLGFFFFFGFCFFYMGQIYRKLYTMKQKNRSKVCAFPNKKRTFINNIKWIDFLNGRK
jgi:hypothetical protein